MSNAEQIRKTLELIEADTKQKYTTKEYLEILLRNAPAKARYVFNKGFLMFNDIMDDPRSALETYRRESQKETVDLVRLLTDIRPEPKYTDKENYLRYGFESRGFSGNNIVLVWVKDSKQSLIICSNTNANIVLVRDFLKHFNIIQ